MLQPQFGKLPFVQFCSFYATFEFHTKILVGRRAGKERKEKRKDFHWNLCIVLCVRQIIHGAK